MVKMNHSDKEYIARLAVELSNELSVFNTFDRKFSRPEQRELFKTIFEALQKRSAAGQKSTLTIEEVLDGFDNPECDWYQGE